MPAGTEWWKAIVIWCSSELNPGLVFAVFVTSQPRREAGPRSHNHIIPIPMVCALMWQRSAYDGVHSDYYDRRGIRYLSRLRCVVGFPRIKCDGCWLKNTDFRTKIATLRRSNSESQLDFHVNSKTCAGPAPGYVGTARAALCILAFRMKTPGLE